MVLCGDCQLVCTDLVGRVAVCNNAIRTHNNGVDALVTHV
jgi:hypothetical protein